MEIALIIVAGAFIALAALERKMRRDMERKIGEIFEYEGKKYKVVENLKSLAGCDNCCFGDESCFDVIGRNGGYCMRQLRTDGKSIYFVEVKE